MKRAPRRVVIFVILAAIGLGLPQHALAVAPVHYGTNSVSFDATGRTLPSGARGRGEIDYNGGTEPQSRWSSTFRFSGLSPNTDYEVVVRGRFGENGSNEATEYSELCSFTSGEDGAGSCFAYFRGLERLDAVQVRQADDDRRVMQATRSSSGVGSITTVPNRFTEPTVRKAKQREAGKASRANGSS